MASFETELAKKEMKEHPKSRSPLIRNIKNIFKKSGWWSESARHALARKGIKTGTSRKISREEMHKIAQLTDEQKKEFRAMSSRAKAIGEPLSIEEFLELFQEEKDYEKRAHELLKNVKFLDFTPAQKSDYRNMLLYTYRHKLPLATPEEYLVTISDEKDSKLKWEKRYVWRGTK